VKISQELTTKLAKSVLLQFAEDAGNYNKSWAYWAYDVGVGGAPREVSEGVFVTVVAQENDPYDSYGSSNAGYIVFRFLAEEQGEELYFKVEGKLSSYSSEWDNVEFAKVKGVQRTVTVWE